MFLNNIGFFTDTTIVKFKFHQEVRNMTVATQVKQTLAGLKSAQASFETFALQTENKSAKQMYQNAAQQTQQIVDTLNARVQEIQNEEPQYNG